MAGLRKILKSFGELKVTKDGETITYLWDYANDCPVSEADMPMGSDRHTLSERAKWMGVKPS